MPRSDTHENVDRNFTVRSEGQGIHFVCIKEVVTILRAVHKYKDSREQFERRTHKRLIDVVKPSPKTVEALMSLELPAGVEIEIKL